MAGRVFRITEKQYYLDENCEWTREIFCGSETFLIDEDKIEQFRIDRDFEFFYVESLIDSILKGFTNFDNYSRKYSFSDTPEWWTSLAPDPQDDRPVVEIIIDMPAI